MIVDALLDTDIFSGVARARDATVVSRAAAYLATGRRLAVSTPTVAEVVAGHQQRGQWVALQRFLDRIPSLEVHSLTEAAAIQAGRIAGDLRRTGQPIGDVDPLIAGIALTLHRTLVTGNTNHYQRIVALGYDLKLDNWREPPSG